MQYRAEIDGLRSIAVIPVILFHAGFNLFGGGFVGVDVFFVISGYLITTLLIEDIENNRFSLVAFYERRARRILPALLLVLFVCIPFAWMWMLPGQMRDFSQSIVAVSLFASNVLFWLETDYFASAAEEKPLLHTWRLAVEEQYYLLFPLFLIVAWRLGKDRLFWTLLALAVVSLLFSEWSWRNQAAANFYLAPTRVWELFAGSISAFIVQRRGIRRGQIFALAGLLMILTSMVIYDKETPFPSSYALLPVLGVVLIILFAEKETLVAKLLSSRILVAAGLLSYSAYLWHQPLFAFAKIRLHEPSKIVLAILAISSFAIAALSWKYVEQPFRKRDGLLKSRVSLFSFSIVALLAFTVFGLIGHATGGFQAVGEKRQGLSQLAGRISANHGLSPSCDGKFSVTSKCANSDEPELVIWGDSYAMHLYQGISASKPETGIRQFTLSGCSPMLDIARLNPVENKDYHWAQNCLAFNQSVFKWLENSTSVEFVVLSSRFDWVGNERSINTNGIEAEPNLGFAILEFERTVETIRNLGINVVLVSPTPRSGFNIGACLSKKYQFQTHLSCEFDYDESSYRHDFLTSLENVVPIYWLHRDICFHGVCKAEIDGNFIYADSGHLSKEGSSYLGRINDWFSSLESLASQNP